MNLSELQDASLNEIRTALEQSSPADVDSLITHNEMGRAAWFWDGEPTKDSLLEKIRHLAKLDLHVPLAPEELELRRGG